MSDPCIKAVILAAYRRDADTEDETSPWWSHLNFTAEYDIPGIEEPVYVDGDREVALVITGIGNVEAAVTVEALVSSPLVDGEDTYFLTIGSAGTSPDVGTLGSVFINDYILDWDQKHDWSPLDEQRTAPTISEFSFKQTSEVCKKLNPKLVAAAYEIGSSVDLVDSDTAWYYRNEYPAAAARSKPSVAVGASVSGSEFWHGTTRSNQAQLLAEKYGAGTYSTTEMEGFGTAVALERHDLLDRYVSIRGVSNFDRPHPGAEISESITQDELGITICMRNVFRVGSSILSHLLGNWDQWRDGPPDRSQLRQRPPATRR